MTALDDRRRIRELEAEVARLAGSLAVSRATCAALAAARSQDRPTLQVLHGGAA